MNRLSWCVRRLCILGCLVQATTSVAAPPTFDLRDGDRVVLLGATTIERAQSFGFLETELVRRFPGRDLVFRNLGWSGDTVWAESRGIFDPPAKGYARMLEHVARLKPTVIVLAYGSNESFAGESGLKAFEEQLQKLVTDLSPTGARFVLVSPHLVPKLTPPQPDPSAHNDDLKLYSRALAKFAAARNMPFVNLAHDPLALPAGRMHLDARGNAVYAKTFADTLLGRKAADPNIEITANGRVRQADSATVASASSSKTDSGVSLRFTAKLKLLPALAVKSSGHSAGQLTLKVTNLPPGTYALSIDGNKAVSGTAQQWARGLTLTTTPDARQAEKLRQHVIEKNQLYFHRWRPQNVTYLFLFRKHEQGQNAKEIPEFDKLVAAQEVEIARLRQPQSHAYELVRIED